jgi:hypothetical protein
VTREDGVDNLGDYGVLVADDAGEEGIFRAEPGDEILAKLILHAAGEAGWSEFAGAEGA